MRGRKANRRASQKSTAAANGVLTQPTNRLPNESEQIDDDSEVVGDMLIIKRDGTGNKERCRFMLDSGSAVNIMSQEVQNKIGYPLESTDQVLQPLGPDPTRPLGVVRDVEFHFRGKPKTYKELFFVFQDTRFDVLIGREFIDKEKVLQRNRDVFHVSLLERL